MRERWRTKAGEAERRIASAIHQFNEVDDDRNNWRAASALKSIAWLFMALSITQ